MTKNRILGICIIVLILGKSLILDKYIDFGLASWPNIIYLAVLLVLSIIFFMGFKPRTKYFWLWMLAYLVFFVSITLYYYYKG